MTRPRVGVTGGDRGGTASWLATSARLRNVGATPLRLRPRRRASIRDLDAVIIGGGSDVDPRRYGMPRRTAPSRRLREVEVHDIEEHRYRRISRRLSLRPFKRTLAVGAGRIDEARDALEVDLIELALDEHLPLLGICRGAQLLNVVQGGTLHQDLRDSELNPSSRYGLRAKDPIHVTPDTRLHRALGCTSLRVNHLHNQAVDRVGRDLVVVARDLDGVVEGIEMTTTRFVVGVQWHPEYLPGREDQTRLFDTFVGAARNGH